MNKTLKLGLLLLTLILSIGLVGCTEEPIVGESFTVTFYDKYAEQPILKTITCTVGTPCDIEAPAEPSNKDNGYFTRWSVWESEYASLDSDTTITPIYTYDNVLVSIGSRDIVFYSFFIMLGIMAALFLGLREEKRTGVDQDALMDGFLWIVPVAILGARLWYVAFELDQFLVQGDFFASLLKILGFQRGELNFADFGLSGLAIHGAFFVAIVCAFFFTRKRKLNILKVIDIVAVGFILAQAFGRWGNFFNQEAHGGLIPGATFEAQYNYLRYTLGVPEFVANNMYLAAGTNGYDVTPVTGYYHPTFYYESMINLIGFGLMLVLRRIKSIRFGELMSLYLIWYGANRIFIESMRTDPLTYDLFGLTLKTATTTSVLMILGGIGLSLFIRFKLKGEAYGTVKGCIDIPKKAITE